jgi:hypothetical protein
MTKSQLNTKDILKMAHATAVQHINQPLKDQATSPQMLAAIDRVWALVKDRMGSAETAELDTLIKGITKKARTQ